MTPTDVKVFLVYTLEMVSSLISLHMDRPGWRVQGPEDLHTQGTLIEGPFFIRVYKTPFISR